MLNEYDYSVQAIKIEPTMLVDEYSNFEYYIGTSKSFKDQSKPNWKIKKIWKTDSVWYSGYPNGNQDFSFVWNDRYGYAYS